MYFLDMDKDQNFVTFIPVQFFFWIYLWHCLIPLIILGQAKNGQPLEWKHGGNFRHVHILLWCPHVSFLQEIRQTNSKLYQWKLVS